MWRLLYLLTAAGFAGQAVAAWLGGSPPWPNPYVWGIVASAASLTLLVYSFAHERLWLRIATATVILAAVGRSVGWVITDRPLGSKLAASSVWVVVGTFALLVYVKAGEHQ